MKQLNFDSVFTGLIEHIKSTALVSSQEYVVMEITKHFHQIKPMKRN